MMKGYEGSNPKEKKFRCNKLNRYLLNCFRVVCWNYSKSGHIKKKRLTMTKKFRVKSNITVRKNPTGVGRRNKNFSVGYKQIGLTIMRIKITPSNVNREKALRYGHKLTPLLLEVSR